MTCGFFKTTSHPLYFVVAKPNLSTRSLATFRRVNEHPTTLLHRTPTTLKASSTPTSPVWPSRMTTAPNHRMIRPIAKPIRPNTVCRVRIICVQSVDDTCRRVPSIASCANSVSRNGIITAFGWIAVSVNRITSTFWLAVCLRRLHCFLGLICHSPRYAIRSSYSGFLVSMC